MVVTRLAMAFLLGSLLATATLAVVILYKRPVVRAVSRSGDFITTDLGSTEGVTVRLVVHRSLGRQWLVVENDQGVAVSEIKP